jgi:4-amino-4-deoxy-L-arabinose transferase-like glycosyltransferase
VTREKGDARFAERPPDESPRRRAPRTGLVLVAILLVAAFLRLLFLTADPPWQTTVGVVWHDEGAWVHNARNRVLFGEWRLDDWNPVFVAPVFTAFQYVSFVTLGVGTWQARLVSVGAGLLSVLLIGLGMHRLGGPRAAVIAATLLATNYVHAMYTRAALMEPTMIAFLVLAWYAFVRSQDSPRWGLVAAMAAWLAFFTKATAVFFLPALAGVAMWPLLASWWARPRGSAEPPVPDRQVRAAWWTLAGLALAGLAALAVFVLPNWREYWFYNWQMSVTRRPSYDLRALADRVSWFPIVHDFFTRMWFVTVVGTAAALGMLSRLTRAAGGERLLVAWLALGTLGLIARDVGNERYLVYLVPALVGLAALALGRDGRLVPESLARVPRRRVLLALPLVLGAAYLATGAVIRLAFLYETRPGVRWSALAAVVLTAAVYVTWPRVPFFLSRHALSPAAAIGITAVVAAGDLVQWAQWAGARTYRNVEASHLVGAVLPPGTLVHGKLANGLSLENRIRPVFIGDRFGNYADRLERDDIRYVLTYVAPRVGYEGPVIREVLDAYPEHRILLTFQVAETSGGRDRAALIEKGPVNVSRDRTGGQVRAEH